jgi:hypothetical protein
MSLDECLTMASFQDSVMIVTEARGLFHNTSLSS